MKFMKVYLFGVDKASENIFRYCVSPLNLSSNRSTFDYFPFTFFFLVITSNKFENFNMYVSPSLSYSMNVKNFSV